MQRWEDLLEGIEKEADPRVLHKKYTLQDNFVLLLTLDGHKKEDLEDMLESYPRAEGFDENFRMFGVKCYWVGETNVRYSPRRSKGYVDWFERSGEPSGSNASISFHTTGKDYASSLLSGKQSVIEISRKIMELNIPFESAIPASRYTPK